MKKDKKAILKKAINGVEKETPAETKAEKGIEEPISAKYPNLKK